MCNIVDIDEFQLQEMTLIENIQRDDLTDFEKAKYIGLMWSTGRYEKKQDLAAAFLRIAPLALLIGPLYNVAQQQKLQQHHRFGPA